MTLALYTRTLIIAEARRQLQERLGEGALFQTADLERWVDLAIIDVTTKTRCLRTEASAYSVSGQQSYSLPNSCLGAWAVTRFEYAGKKIEEVPFDQLDQMFARAASKTRTSNGVPLYWIPYGRGFKLWPVPSVSGLMRIWFAQVGDAMSADTVALSDLDISNAYGPAVEDYVVMRGLMLQGDQQRAEAMRKVYEYDLSLGLDKTMNDKPPEGDRGT